MAALATAGANGTCEIFDAVDTTDVSDTVNSGDIPGTAVTPDMRGPPGPPVSPRTIYRVIARDGLLMRGGPGTDFPVVRSLPYGTQVNVLRREGQWVLIDIQGDRAADGFAFSAFLDAGATPPAPSVDTGSEGDQFVIIKPPLLQTIMDRCAGMKIKSKLDLWMVSDALTRSMIKADANNRKREIGFLSQAVIQTDYFRTFEEYGKGAGKAYSPYYGRGIHQLKWRDTYAACSQALFSDDRLVRDPDLILKDIQMNITATAWFWRNHKKLNPFADAGDVDEIIYLIYGDRIASHDIKIRKSVILKRSYYKTIDGLLDQHSI
jgi:predicted chitinase